VLSSPSGIDRPTTFNGEDHLFIPSSSLILTFPPSSSSSNSGPQISLDDLQSATLIQQMKAVLYVPPGNPLTERRYEEDPLIGEVVLTSIVDEEDEAYEAYELGELVIFDCPYPSTSPQSSSSGAIVLEIANDDDDDGVDERRTKRGQYVLISVDSILCKLGKGVSLRT
jgi:hypothetical protein